MEKWWDALLVFEEKIDLSKIDATKPMEDLAEDEQMKIQELVWNQERKRQGLPTSDQLVSHCCSGTIMDIIQASNVLSVRFGAYTVVCDEQCLLMLMECSLIEVYQYSRAISVNFYHTIVFNIEKVVLFSLLSIYCLMKVQ
jgi:hypothetical protein